MAGTALALEKKRLVPDLTSWFSQSAGVVVGLYTSSGLAELGSSLIPNEFVRGKFISPKTPWKLENVEYLRNLFNSIKPPNLAQLMRSKTNFYIAVTDEKTGVGRFLDFKSADNPIELVLGSLNWGCINGGTKTRVNNTSYIDGGYSCGIPTFPEDENVLYFLFKSPFKKSEGFCDKVLEKASEYSQNIILKGLATKEQDAKGILEN